MLWFILIFFILMAIPAVIISASNRAAVMDALAMHENLKRSHPDDALGQLGPHEFQRAFNLARLRRHRKLVKGFLLWGFLGLIIAIPIASLMFAMDSDTADTLGMLTFVGAPLGLAWYGMKSARSKMPELFDQMRTELRL